MSQKFLDVRSVKVSEVEIGFLVNMIVCQLFARRQSVSPARLGFSRGIQTLALCWTISVACILYSDSGCC